eukprot:TRINITY_DN238_c0_g3_i2.p1 TRINITY_DN238_c0_g3~~TRINITY_DN238_c0_g3_i2.p1  ORF type:complete len:156 (+),score=19.98 TRINITY_DN238_c0_g3_i2:17-484(+)
MAVANASASLCLSLRDVNAAKAIQVRALPQRLPSSKIARTAATFIRGSPLCKISAVTTPSSLVWRTSSQRKSECKSISVSIRCDQNTKESSGLDVWLGRLAMVGFAAAITVEIITGRGLLENFGLTSPLPTMALAVTALIGVLTAVFVFQSASSD